MEELSIQTTAHGTVMVTTPGGQEYALKAGREGCLRIMATDGTGILIRPEVGNAIAILPERD